jgi:sodium transport system permease protein
MNISRIMVVARKEFTDGLRDRRSIRTVALSALFGPLLIAFMFNQLARQNKAAQEIQVPVVGREFGQVLVNWLEQQAGVEIVPGPSDPEAAVRDNKADFVLVIDKEFSAKFSESRPAPVQVLSDSTRQSSQPKVRRLTTLLSGFSAETGGLRLIARGVSPAVASALKVQEVNVANSQQRAATLLNVILVFLVVAVLTAGMQIATDSTAGERERASLEPLLLNPVPRWQLAAGKWLASVGGAVIGLVVTLLITRQILSRLSLEDLGVRFHLGMPQMLLLVAAIGPTALWAPAIQVYLSCFAKSFKEAQSYSAFLVLAACVPGVLSTIYPIANRPWMQPIPVLGQYALGTAILSGKVPSPLILISAVIEALALSALLLWMTARLFSSEKIIFGRS